MLHSINDGTPKLRPRKQVITYETHNLDEHKKLVSQQDSGPHTEKDTLTTFLCYLHIQSDSFTHKSPQ